MNKLVRLLFHEVADLSPAERARIFSLRAVAPDVRAEIESLLKFDSGGGHLLTNRISQVAAEVWPDDEPAEVGSCGPYRVIRLLGSGGMGAVYLAERVDGEIQQKVAIKLLRADANRASWQERFLRERQLLAYLNHVSVARLLDAGHTAGGRPYLVMEYVDGVPIDVYAADKDLRTQLELFLRVCEGVAHAHHHLIIHRDLKPSNILVDASGQPKLLDFGIAKLVDATADPTQTVERLLTPNYASPEQLRGTIQTTATDVYSLGAVLYRLLTGRSPHEGGEAGSQALEILAGTREIPPPEHLNPNLPVDLAFILRKALRNEPRERYPTVDELIGDVRAFLESRPVRARSGDTWYRTRKFLRRYWVPVAAGALVLASLSAGLYLANRQRLLAERRFDQLRKLSAKVFELDQVIRNLPGSTRVRQNLVSASLEYLEGLASDANKDVDLARDVGEGYWRVGRVQGVPTDLNLGQALQAEVNLQKADRFIDLVLASRPQDRKALLLSGVIAEDRMILADSDRRRADALEHARKATERLDRLWRLGDVKGSDFSELMAAYLNIALAYLNAHRYADSAILSRRAIDLTKAMPSERERTAAGLSILASALRYQGDLDGALAAIVAARNATQQAAYPDPATRMIDLYGVMLRQGLILGEDGNINLNRPREAIDILQSAVDLTEEYARKDPNDSLTRARVGTSTRELGNILRHTDPRRALAVYDLGIRRLSETHQNLKASRGRAVLLAASSYPLRKLHRNGEAAQRIAAAIRILTETKDYPAARISLESEAYTVISAMADDAAARGDVSRAIQLYEDLLSRVRAARPEPLTDLRDAPRISAIYQAVADLYHRAGDRARAEDMKTRRVQLWSQWDQRLPHNPYVIRQLAIAHGGPE